MLGFMLNRGAFFHGRGLALSAWIVLNGDMTTTIGDEIELVNSIGTNIASTTGRGINLGATQSATYFTGTLGANQSSGIFVDGIAISYTVPTVSGLGTGTGNDAKLRTNSTVATIGKIRVAMTVSGISGTPVIDRYYDGATIVAFPSPVTLVNGVNVFEIDMAVSSALHQFYMNDDVVWSLDLDVVTVEPVTATTVNTTYFNTTTGAWVQSSGTISSLTLTDNHNQVLITDTALSAEDITALEANPKLMMDAYYKSYVFPSGIKLSNILQYFHGLEATGETVVDVAGGTSAYITNYTASTRTADNGISKGIQRLSLDSNNQPFMTSDYDFQVGRIAQEAVVTRGTGSTYYVDATNGLDTNDGLSELTAWKTLAQARSFSYPAGTSILLKRGESWIGERIISFYYPSGTATEPIYYGNYGDTVDPLPIVQNTEVLGGTWTATGSGVPNEWVSSLTGRNDGRMWRNGVEILKARSWPTADDDVSALQPWKMGKSGDGLLYIYSVTDPNTNGDEYMTHSSASFYINNQSYIHIDGIQFNGEVHIAGASNNLHIANNILGMDMYGLVLRGNDSIVEQNYIHSQFSLDFSWLPAGGTGADDVGPQDGIVLWVGERNTIRDNEVIDWSHSSIAMTTTSTAIITANKVYRNSCSAPSVAYGGRFGWSGANNYGNEIYNNHLFSIAVRSQMAGHSNHVHHNLIDGVSNSPLKTINLGQGIQLEAYNGNVYSNIYEYNIIRNTDGAGIDIETYGASSELTIYDNIFRYNLLENCGLDTASGDEMSINIDNLNYNDYIGNIIIDDAVRLNSTIINVTTFNTDARASLNIITTPIASTATMSTDVTQAEQIIAAVPTEAYSIKAVGSDGVTYYFTDDMTTQLIWVDDVSSASTPFVTNVEFNELLTRFGVTNIASLEAINGIAKSA